MPNDTSDAVTDDGILLKIDANVELLSENKENIPEDNFNASVPNIKNADIVASEDSKVDLESENNEKILEEEQVNANSSLKLATPNKIQEDNFNSSIPKIKNTDIVPNEESKVELSNADDENFTGKEQVDVNKQQLLINSSLTLATPNKIQEDNFSTSIKNTDIVPNKDSKEQDLLTSNDDSLNFAKPSLPMISKAGTKMETPKSIPENIENRQEFSMNTSQPLYGTPNTQFYETANSASKFEISNENIFGEVQPDVNNQQLLINTSLTSVAPNKFVPNDTSDAIICTATDDVVLEVNTKVELSSESNENIPKVEQADVNKQQLLINSSLTLAEPNKIEGDNFNTSVRNIKDSNTEEAVKTCSGQVSAVEKIDEQQQKIMENDEEPMLPKRGGYNLDFLDNLDDPNFNPFETKTKVSNNFSEDQPISNANRRESFDDKLNDPNFNPFETKSKVII